MKDVLSTGARVFVDTIAKRLLCPWKWAFSWTGWWYWWHWLEKEAFLWPRRETNEKETPSKSVSVYGVEQGGTVEKPWLPVASWTGGAQRSWEGFSFSTVPPCYYLLSAVATSTAQATLNLPLGCYRCRVTSCELCVRVHTTHSVGHSLRSECQHLSYRPLKSCKSLSYIRIFTPS